MVDPSGLYYPNRIARAFFAAMDDVMGENGLATLLSLADLDVYIENPPPDNLAREFDFAAIAALNIALEEMYGVKGGRGIALKIGQSTFAKGLQNFGVMRAMNDPIFRTLALEKRVEYGLNALASVLSHFSDQSSVIETEDGVLFFKSALTPFSYQRTADKPVCHMMTGILMESLRWASNGYDFYVREVACRATGAHDCTFRVSHSTVKQKAD